MKKIILALLLMLGITGYSYSQQTQKTPEERAQGTSTKLGKELSLTQNQITNVYNAALIRIKAVEEARTNNASNKEAMRSQVKAANESYDAQMKTILTPEQYTQWKQLEEEQRAKAKEHRQ